MIINGKDYKINILILSMVHEIEVAIQTIETLLESIEDQITISILLNGGQRKDLRGFFSKYPSIKYYEFDTNLGVAGGRNFLLKTEECKQSDIVMLLDNDVIPPIDYIRSLATFLVNNDDAGIVGSSVLDLRHFNKYLSDSGTKKTGCFGNEIYQVTNQEIKNTLLKNFNPQLFYHIGINKDWYNVYIHPIQYYETICMKLGIMEKHTLCASLKFDENYTSLYKDTKNERFEVSNVIGCSQAFYRKLIEEIGYLNDLFNPYAFEDSDFCKRVMKKGYKNYTATNIFLLHGTDNRHTKRMTPENISKTQMNLMRSFTILAYLYFPNSYKDLIANRVVLNFINSSLKEHTPYESLYHEMKGYKKAIEQIKANHLAKP